MKILVISFYYPPDLSAGSFRTLGLINELLKVMPPKSQIELITSLPTRYDRFSADAPKREEQQGVVIHRIRLPKHRNSFFGQALSFLVFAIGALKIARGERPDLVFGTSSRLMTATLASFVARKYNTLLYLDIRDLFLETLRDVSPSLLYRVLFPILSYFENYAIRSAHHVNLVSEGFKRYFTTRYSTDKFSFFTNGIDHQFFVQNRKTRLNATRFRVVYAGNFGKGQGLEKIIPKLAKVLENRVDFIFIGDGNSRVQFEAALSNESCNNVTLQDPIPREELIKEYNNADILFLHLNDLKAFEKVLPSKLFEYAATGKPIWAGVSGYAANFIDENVENCSLFAPCDIESAISALDRLEICFTPRTHFIERFRRDKIMRAMALDINNLVLNDSRPRKSP